VILKSSWKPWLTLNTLLLITARANTPSTAGCEAERTRAAVLAELLGEADALAQGYATEADRNRLAGLARKSA